MKTIDVIEHDAGLLVGVLAGYPERTLLSKMPGAYELMPNGLVPSLFSDVAGGATTPFQQAAALPTYYDRALLAAAGQVVQTLTTIFPARLRIVEGYGVDTAVSARLDPPSVNVLHGLGGDGTCPSESLLAATSTKDRKVLSIPFAEHVPLVAHPVFLRFLREDLVFGSPSTPQVFANVRYRLAPGEGHDLLLVQARDEDGAPIPSDPPHAKLPHGGGLSFSALSSAGGIWAARFAHPLLPGHLRVTVPGVSNDLQPRPILLG